jgi:hypothetical protein
MVDAVLGASFLQFEVLFLILTFKVAGLTPPNVVVVIKDIISLRVVVPIFNDVIHPNVDVLSVAAFYGLQVKSVVSWVQYLKKYFCSFINRDLAYFIIFHFLSQGFHKGI